VVDDEPAVLRALRVALESQGYGVIVAQGGEQAVRHAAADGPDLIVLDLGLPDIDGLEVIRRVRSFASALPILVLSAWGEDRSKVEALDLGADDYVVKPFAVPELLARVRVGLRHAQRSEGAGHEGARLERGPLVVDTAAHRVWLRGREVSLTRTQFSLLECLARRPGRVMTHRAIVSEVWGDPGAADAQNLRAFISQLRRRIEDDPARPRFVHTEPGVGYRFELRDAP
jgi:two-component system KDP operon response regulator KdpE